MKYKDVVFENWPKVEKEFIDERKKSIIAFEKVRHGYLVLWQTSREEPILQAAKVFTTKKEARKYVEMRIKEEIES